MGKKGKVGKNRQDKFYHLAKEQGFRSRASFKLVQLNKRHDFLSTASHGVVDLCAAPGGWMQVARKHMPVHAPCIGIDLVPIRAVPGCTGIVGDITTDSARADLKRALFEARGLGGEGKVDVVLNDGSPNMGKAWLQDAYTQSELTLAALKLATDFLRPGGTFVTKVFRSHDYNSLLFVMNQLFRRVNATKPAASRAESAEIYVMCLGYAAPKTIDSRLLNPKYVFKDMGGEQPSEADKPDLFLNTVMKDMKKRKRNRGGYEDGQMILFKKVSVLDYCRTARPVAMMVDSSQFSFDSRVIAETVGNEEAKSIVEVLKGMPETTPEVMSCCEDLKVLARRDFKLLLKWRAAARAALGKLNLLEGQKRSSDAEEIGTGDEAERVGDGLEGKVGMDMSGEDADESEEETDIDEEMKKVRAEALARDKRKRRKANKLRSANQRKIDMKIILPEADSQIGEDIPDGLFSISTAKKAQKYGAEIIDVPMYESDGAADADNEMSGDEATAEKSQVSLPYKAGCLDESRVDQEAIEEDLDRWYKVYLSRKKRDKNGVLLQESKERKRLTKRKAIREALKEQEAMTGDGDEPEGEKRSGAKLMIDSSESSDDGFGEDIHVSSSARKSREAALWFSQPMFDGVVAISSDDDVDGVSDEENTARLKGSSKAGENIDMDYEIIEREGEDIHAAARQEAQAMANEIAKKRTSEGDGFDVVPRENENETSRSGDESSSSFHSSDYDTDEKAEMVAIGRRMRRGKTEANNVLDEAYNRYTFDDPIDLPRWFADPDPAYRKRQAPVTKEQVSEMKDYIKSLQAAPTKKEAEAKARRKARVEKKLEAMKAKANSIAEQGDVPASSRMRAIEDLYKQAMKKGGKKNKRKQYQVVRPGGRMNVGNNSAKGRRAMRGVHTTLVDRRLKADKRGLAKAAARRRSGK
eukprot:GFKZ01001005.1.p1 GENE.GFKZ01001005.1~~GFKZ01001005.1.p1  ORF type:complete len:947 (-),score=206.85 GFKZ01001005.1:425-3199(-)